MMKRIHILILSMLASALSSVAQLPVDFRSEQIYLAPQSTTYLPGDTVRVEGQVTCVARGRVFPYSRYLYVELIDDNDIVITRQKIGCNDRGYFRTDVVLSPSQSVGQCYLRAYTQLMRNFSLGSFAQQPISVGVTTDMAFGEASRDTCVVSVDGGVLIPGVPQTVTAVVQSGRKPVAGRHMRLLDADGEIVAKAVTSPSGFATFSFIPLEGVTYEIAGSSDSYSRRYPVPAVDITAVKLLCSLTGRRLAFNIVGGIGPIPAERHIYVYDRFNGLSHLELIGNSGVVEFAVDPSVVTLFLTDGDHNIVAERTVAQPASRTDTSPVLAMSDTVVSAGELQFALQDYLPDTSAIVIKRIVPDNESLAASAVEALCFHSDFDSPLPFPSRIGNGSPADGRSDIQAWLSTARFKRFTIKDVAVNDTAIYSFMPEMALSIEGQAVRKKKFPVKSGTVVAYNTRNYFVYDVPVTEDGRFRIAVDDFDEGTEFFVQYINDKGKAEWLEFKMPDDSYPPVFIDSRLRNTDLKYFRRSGIAMNDSVDGSYLLPDVIVKARAQMEKHEDSKTFYGFRYKDRDEIERRHYHRLLDVLKDMPVIEVYKGRPFPTEEEEEKMLIANKNYDSTVSHGPGESRWIIRTRRGTSLLFKNPSIPLLLDGTKYEEDMYDMILNMSADELESVEYLAPSEAQRYSTYALNGAVLVKTRGLSRPIDKRSKGMVLRPAGLTDSPDALPEQLFAPSSPGHYRLLVDVIGRKGIHSFQRSFEVVDSQ